MSALRFLFWRRASQALQRAFLTVGYEPQRRELSERLYGVYLLLFGIGWVLVMLSLAVRSLGEGLATLNIPTDQMGFLLFLGLALGLAVTPFLAQRRFALLGLSLADVDFLANAPLSSLLVVSAWFGRSLVKLAPAVFVLAGGVVGSAIGFRSRTNDLLGLALGLAASALFCLLVWALRWVLALLRYRPRPRFGPLLGYGLTALGLALAVTPWSRPIFWPAALTSWLVVDANASPNGGEWAGGALLGLGLTTGVVLVALALVARTTWLTPALEESSLGAQTGGIANAGGLAAQDARWQRRLARQAMRSTSQPLPKPRWLSLSGATGALWVKQWWNLRRSSPWQILIGHLIPLGVGAAAALGLVVVTRYNSGIGVVGPLALFANLRMIASATAPLRRDLAHWDFLSCWPLSRQRLVNHHLVIGFGLPGLVGELALLVGGASGLTWESVAPWLFGWPILVAASAALTACDLDRLLYRWPATAETVPETGPVAVLLASLAWLGYLLGGPNIGLLVCVSLVSGYVLYLRISRSLVEPAPSPSRR